MRRVRAYDSYSANGKLHRNRAGFGSAFANPLGESRMTRWTTRCPSARSRCARGTGSRSWRRDRPEQLPPPSHPSFRPGSARSPRRAETRTPVAKPRPLMGQSSMCRGETTRTRRHTEGNDVPTLGAACATPQSRASEGLSDHIALYTRSSSSVCSLASDQGDHARKRPRRLHRDGDHRNRRRSARRFPRRSPLGAIPSTSSSTSQPGSRPSSVRSSCS